MVIKSIALSLCLLDNQSNKYFFSFYLLKLIIQVIIHAFKRIVHLKMNQTVDGTH